MFIVKATYQLNSVLWKAVIFLVDHQVTPGLVQYLTLNCCLNPGWTVTVHLSKSAMSKHVCLNTITSLQYHRVSETTVWYIKQNSMKQTSKLLHTLLPFSVLQI